MMKSLPLCDAWADPDLFNSRFNRFMDEREAMIKELLESPYPSQIKQALHFIRSGIKEEIEMQGIGKGGRMPLKELPEDD